MRNRKENLFASRLAMPGLLHLEVLGDTKQLYGGFATGVPTLVLWTSFQNPVVYTEDRCGAYRRDSPVTAVCA
jgi:hypothetical protein